MKTKKKLQEELEFIINKHFSTTINTVFIISSLIFIAILGILIFQDTTITNIYVYGSLIFVLIISVILINKNRRKKLLAKTKLKNAQGYIRINVINSTLTNLVEAYKILPNKNLFKFIFSYAEFMHPSLKDQLPAIELEYTTLKKHKRDKYINILEQIIEARDKITKYQDVIQKSQNKINELTQEYENLDDRELKIEIKKIIERYKQIVYKSNKQIKTLEQKIAKLVKMRYKYLLTQMINKEKQYLKQIENQVFDSFILDDIDTLTNSENINHITVEEKISKEIKQEAEIEKQMQNIEKQQNVEDKKE